MNADCDFQIGKDHLVCQDYAIAAAREGEAYAILCDGCSASPDVDIGARLLAISAKETHLNGTIDTYENFGYCAINRASKIFEMFPTFHPQALDATLLFASIKGTELKSLIYGDGVFFHKSVNGLYAMRIELTSGAPDYLSYNLLPERKNEYVNYSLEYGETKEITVYDGEIRTVGNVPPFAPVVLSRTVQPGDIIAVCSDGIGSFRRGDNSSIPWMELAEEFIGYKSLTGVFVKRRLMAFRKKCIKEGWTHSDDISIAAIAV